MRVAVSVPEVIGVSELRTRQAEILKRLREGPVVLVHRNQPLAVLVDVEQWNSLIEELADLRDGQIARERLAEGPEALQPLGQVKEELRAEGLLDD